MRKHIFRRQRDPPFSPDVRPLAANRRSACESPRAQHATDQGAVGPVRHRGEPAPGICTPLRCRDAPARHGIGCRTAYRNVPCCASGAAWRELERDWKGRQPRCGYLPSIPLPHRRRVDASHGSARAFWPPVVEKVSAEEARALWDARRHRRAFPGKVSSGGLSDRAATRKPVASGSYCRTHRELADHLSCSPPI